MAEGIQNKKSASEDDLGTVHRLVTQGFKQKIGDQVKKAKRSGNAGKINTADLAAAARWCGYNGIVANGKAEEELAGITDELEEIRNRQRGSKLTASGED